MSQPINQQLVYLLTHKKLTCAVAESCTGGLVAASITDVSGASQVFAGGVVTYTNDTKQKILLVNSETLRQHSAVSPHTATEMAVGVRRLTGADIAASVTGNAGPEPSEGKPVGMVWVAVDSVLGTQVVEMKLDGVPMTRDGIRQAAVQCVLEIIYSTAAML